jgi:hypothetical protein
MFWKPPSNSDHLDLAPLGFDNFFGLITGRLDPDGQGDMNGTLTQKLNPASSFFDQTGSDQGFGIHDGISGEPGQIPDIDNRPRLFEDIGKTPFGQTPDEGHLTAFKGRTDFSPGA